MCVPCADWYIDQLVTLMCEDCLFTFKADDVLPISPYRQEQKENRKPAKNERVGPKNV